MAFEFEESLARLADIENTDDGAVLAERGKEVSVVRGCGDAEQGWREGEGRV
jgi:hypothetical protein